MDQTFQECVNSHAQSTRNFHSTITVVATVSEWQMTDAQIQTHSLSQLTGFKGQQPRGALPLHGDSQLADILALYGITLSIYYLYKQKFSGQSGR